LSPHRVLLEPLFELALAADRSYMLAATEKEKDLPKIALSEMNFGLLPMVNGAGRLESRFPRRREED